MEKLNNTAKVLEEICNTLNFMVNDEFLNISNDIDNIESAITMASAFTDNLAQFSRKNEVVAGYQVIGAVLEILKNRVDDTTKKILDVSRQFKEII